MTMSESSTPPFTPEQLEWLTGKFSSVTPLSDAGSSAPGASSSAPGVSAASDSTSTDTSSGEYS